MKNKVRARRNAGTKITSLQPKISRAKSPAATPPKILLMPSDVARRVLDKLALMEHTGKAAAALLMMMAVEAKADSESADGWQSLDVPGFGEGVVALARFITGDFQLHLADEAKGISAMAEQIRTIEHPTEPDFGSKNLAAQKTHYVFASYEFEFAVDAFRHLLNLLGIICSDHQNEGHQIAHAPAFAIADRLGEQLAALRDAQQDLHSVFASLSVDTKKQSSQS